MVRRDTSLQRWVSRVVLGTIAPVSGLLIGWWSCYLLGVTDWVAPAALSGLLLGVAADLTVLRSRLDSLYRLSVPAQVAVAAFYTVMIYGFFMGFPVPVLLVSVGWGYAVARAASADDARRVRWAAPGSALLMLVACVATAWLAFREPWIAGEVRGMLGLSFTPSLDSLAVASVIGGLFLVSSAYAIPAVMLLRRRSAGEGARSAA